jgi:hypothetical protein
MILLCDCFFKWDQQRRPWKWKMEERERFLKEIMSCPMKFRTGLVALGTKITKRRERGA